MAYDHTRPDPTPSTWPTRRDEHITQTGLRITGKRARDLIDRFPGAEQLRPSPDEDVLFTDRFQVRPRLGSADPVDAILATLGTTINRIHPEVPPLARARPVEITPNRFVGLTWNAIDDGGRWIGELLWRHLHPVLSGTPCTTQVVIIEQPGHLGLHVRVSADGGRGAVRGSVGVGQARPAFLNDLNRPLRLLFDNHDGDPRLLPEARIDSFVRDTLLAEDREYPIALLTPIEGGGYGIPPQEMAAALLGLAPLYYIDRHPATFRLSDTIGDRRLSAYWGALRIYMPGFSCADRPEEHPLLVLDRLVDPVMRDEVIGKLSIRVARRHPRPPSVVELRTETDAPKAVTTAPKVELVLPSPPASADAAERTAVAQVPEVRPVPVVTLDPVVPARLEELQTTVARLVELVQGLVVEVNSLRTATAVRSASAASLERRIGSLETLLERHLAPPDTGTSPEASPAPETVQEERPEHEEPAPTIVEIVRQAATSHPDALFILESAERSAAQSPYEDLDRLAAVLDAMAAVARRRQDGNLGVSLRDAFRESGVDYRSRIAPSTPERLRQQYRIAGPGARIYECEEHIVLGHSYDPRRCLRIYFTSRAPLDSRLVIGHVGRHFEVLSTT